VTKHGIKIFILMKKTSILLISLFVTISSVVYGQTTQKSDSVQTFEKAKYLKEDLTAFLGRNVNYPDQALINNIEGDVVLSLIINKNGKSDSLTILKSPDLSLSTSSIIAFNRADEAWGPSKLNGNPVDRKYNIIFRYRISSGTVVPDSRGKAAELCKKNKYEKAIDVLDKAIRDSPYDYELFESRSEIKAIIGDSVGSKQDLITSNNIKNEVMSVVNIYNRKVESPIQKTIIRTEIRTVEVHH
jgi:hypothetical protein